MLEQVLERIAIALEKIADKEVTHIAKAEPVHQPNTIQDQVPQNQMQMNMPQPIQSQQVQQPVSQSQSIPQNQITAAPIKEYSMQELAIAGRDLYMKNPQRLTAILQNFGIEALTLLPKERYGEMANLLIMEGVLK